VRSAEYLPPPVQVLISYRRFHAQSASCRLAEALKLRFGPEAVFFDAEAVFFDAETECRRDIVRPSAEFLNELERELGRLAGVEVER
jgi:hypothetical protein